MKFSNDKKSSLFIYANETTKGSDKMEVSLKKELEATKAALKLQTIRCRQLVAAFTRKLHEKELELRASKDLRDQQLSRLLRALLILESRLKKEQKLIKQQLQEKDSIIRRQEKEIHKYKRTETGRKPEETNFNASEDDQRTLERSLQTGEQRLDNLCKGILNPPPLFLTPIEGEANPSSNSYETTTSCKKDEIAFKDNPVLESVNQILLRDEEELLKTAKPVAINLAEKEERNDGEDAREWYETNSNTIQDDQISGWGISLEDAGETRVRRDVWPGGKTSPIKCQLLQEKACLEMSKKNLTVVDLEEIDTTNSGEGRAVSPVKSTASYEEIAPVSKTTTYKPVPTQQKPPALPPKPARLLKPHQILQQQQQQNSQQQQDPSKDFQKQQLSSPEITSHRQPQSPSGATNPNKPLPNKKPTLNQIHSNTRSPRSDGKPTKPPDFSKNRPKQSDNTTKTKKTQFNSHLPNALDLVPCPVGVPFSKQKKTEDIVTNCRPIKIGSSVSSLITGLSRETIVTELNGEPIVNATTTTADPTNNVPAITLNNNVQDTVQDDSHVSQLVRQFEVLGKNPSERKDSEANDIRKNFEEFKLDESYVEIEENGRHDGDGAENKTMLNYYATLTIVPPSTPKDSVSGTELDYKMYETFLENTGLSQKSILTPSRMLSNHRSCLKPKDVKHRNRVKAAAAFEKCNINASTAGPMVKYWTEPFL